MNSSIMEFETLSQVIALVAMESYMTFSSTAMEMNLQMLLTAVTPDT